MLISASDCANLLGVSATDALLLRLVKSTDAWIKRELFRDLERKTRTEIVRGFGQNCVFLRESPIRAITEVRIDSTGELASSSIVSDLTLFSFDEDEAHDDARLFYRAGTFPIGPRVAKITYEAGWWPFVASGSISSLASVGTTATAQTSSAHGLGTNQQVTITGATPAAYNGTYPVTVTDATHFTYSFAGGTSPATGTITYVPEASDLPSDLAERLIERVAAKYKQGADEEMKSENQGDRSWTKFNETDSRILAALQRYQRVVIV